MIVMKAINIVVEDEDFAKLEKAKGNLSWREFILKAVKQ